ncbi:MAG: RdgB/HAM1 family non-canonical purine NTP pyrophosphatase [Actinomycetia bacterium]|nr:RdgB/HAM1 family non-canonical purine NTP pyrophosphatase [Actinomycetes bacterium]
MRLPSKLLLASANPAKARELAEVLAARLGGDVELVPRPADVPEVAEDQPDFEGNARLKAVALCGATGQAALADDSGLEVDALDGRPGVRSARFAGESADDAANVSKLLSELGELGAGDPGRRARFRCVIVVVAPDGGELVASGTVEGTIAAQQRGESGFGYDPVFVPDDGDGRTFAEMTSDEKHSISHRGRALSELAGQFTIP